MISLSGYGNCHICKMKNTDARLSEAILDDIPVPFGNRDQGSMRTGKFILRTVKVDCSRQHTYHLRCLQEYNEDIQRAKENTQPYSPVVKVGFSERFRDVFFFSDKCIRFPGYIDFSNGCNRLLMAMAYRLSHVPAEARREHNKDGRSEPLFELDYRASENHDSIVDPATERLLSEADKNNRPVSELYYCPECGTGKKVSVVLEEQEVDGILMEYGLEKAESTS